MVHCASSNKGDADATRNLGVGAIQSGALLASGQNAAPGPTAGQRTWEEFLADGLHQHAQRR
jgi:hypothetical protein